ncbi:MAG: substrate-binding domain-containing protein [Actinomycetota bacterium]|nr:substrate-binding domain-containing protein [Actinomycetota bacterium]
MRSSTLTRVLAITMVAGLTLTGCSTSKKDDTSNTKASTSNGKAGNGKKVKIAFSAPAADHGWMAAITKNAKAQAAKYKDVEFISTEGAADAAAQVAQIESLIARKPDVLIILPHDGAALTQVAQQAMAKGIKVVNVDREFTSQSAFTTLIGGDNYGIGQQAGDYIADQLKCKGNVVEIQGLAGISVTTDRSKGFSDAIKRCKGGIKIVAKQPGDFNPEVGNRVMSTILQAQKDIDAVYTHDDDMAQGVVKAITEAKREKGLFVTGAGGSKQAMDLIKAGGIYRATFLYNPVMSASAVSLARLIGQEAGFTELREPGVPSKIILPATQVTKDNVDKVYDLAY